MAVRAGWRFRIGVTIFVAGFAAPLGIPLVVASDLPAAWKTVLSGALAIGLPEVMMVVAAAVMGKEGFAELKDRFGRFFKKYGPPERVSRTRYRVGLLMFSLPLLLAFLGPYFGGHLPGYGSAPAGLGHCGGCRLRRQFLCSRWRVLGQTARPLCSLGAGGFFSNGERQRSQA